MAQQATIFVNDRSPVTQVFVDFGDCYQDRVNLSADAATFSTAGLSAGAHTLTAIYPGDATHAATQSSALALTVEPLSIVATTNPVSILYGQPVPNLTGELSGVLLQDAGNIGIAFEDTGEPVFDDDGDLATGLVGLQQMDGRGGKNTIAQRAQADDCYPAAIRRCGLR